eukprot:14048341-Ditylum_brightwellii.AAC.1
MSGVSHAKCPMYMDIDAPGAMLQMQFCCDSWCWIYASTFAVITWSRKLLRNKVGSIAAVVPSSDNSFKTIALVLGTSG